MAHTTERTRNSRRIWDIPGGVHPPEHKEQSMQLPLAHIPLAPSLIVPLSQHIGAPAIALVKEGDRVLKGQKIAEADGPISAPVHAPTSGTVTRIGDYTMAHPSGLQAEAIEISSDFADTWCELHPMQDYRERDRSEVLHHIRECGIAGLGGAGFPAAIKLNPKGNAPIDTLILNGTECEPYITADDTIMRVRPEEIVAGAEILAHLLHEPADILIGIEDNKPEAIKAMREACKGTRFEVVVFPTKYPSGGEKQLIQILTGREVPSEHLPAEVGVICQNVGTAAAIYRAIQFGEPLVSRITTVVGEALDIQRNIEVPLGTPVGHILANHGVDREQMAKIVIGGPMMGFTIRDEQVPVVKTTNCILVPARNELPAPMATQPCIRCGICAEACPASLLPQQLYWYARAEDYEKLDAYSIKDCIECGACAYVCPSHIPLVQYYRAAKGTMREAEQEKLKSDRARERFEFRKARLEKAEQEKEAKRQARKKAAEEARKRKAAQPASDKAGTGGASSEADVVAAALARVKAKESSPEQQKARAERSVKSAQERVQKLEEKASAAEGTQRDQLQAQLKAAQLKLNEARQKLAALDQPEKTSSAAAAVDAAIARARNKAAMSPLEKAQKSVDSLRQRIQKMEEKIPQEQDAELQAALRDNHRKFQEKLVAAERELAQLQQQEPGEAATPPASNDKAQQAIERARAAAQARAGMSDEEKLAAELSSLEQRVEKARQRLRKAQDEGNENVPAFQAALDKMENKLAEKRQQMGEQQ